LSQSKHLKICILTISLAKGGAERSTALLSKMLDAQGFEVHIVTLTDAIDYAYSGTLFNLGIFKTEDNSVVGRLQRFKKLRRYLRSQQFDYVIDNRNRRNYLKELYYLTYVFKGVKVIYVARSFKLDEYFPKQDWVAKKMIEKASHIVGVSKAIASEINSRYHTKKATTIYNPAEALQGTETPSEAKQPYILFMGRLVEKVKNFSLLLEGYKQSTLPTRSIALFILGDGPDKEWLQKKIEEMQLQDSVKLVAFTPVVGNYVKNALFLVLTSRYEGFPRVLIEALSVGTPVVSVNCKSGPDEIITHEHNGLLLENHDSSRLSKALDRMIEDNALYARVKNNAVGSIEHLKIDEIASQWATLLRNE
jgi:glycosyltransferase involved in cell wall biosynthesis